MHNLQPYSLQQPRSLAGNLALAVPAVLQPRCSFARCREDSELTRRGEKHDVGKLWLATSKSAPALQPGSLQRWAAALTEGL